MFTRGLTICTLLFVLATSAAADDYHPVGTRWKFPQGFCTWFAAVEFNRGSDRIIDFGGHGGNWIDNAEAQNWMVSRDPGDAMPGAIICWNGGRFGHVGIVRQVIGETVVVDEMNGGDLVINADDGLTNEFNTVKTRHFNSFRRLSRGGLKFAGFIFPATALQVAAR